MSAFTIYWHRHGNVAARVAAVQAARRSGPAVLAGRPVQQGVELDLKWAPDPATGDLLLYCHHGATGRARLDATEAREQIAQGRAALLDDILGAAEASELRWLIDLKCGHGAPELALAALARVVERHHLTERVSLATSSLYLLAVAAERAPHLARVLFSGPADSRRRVRHRPTTYVRESWQRFGAHPQLEAGFISAICTVDLVVRGAAVHVQRSSEAEGTGIAYLPGRVTSMEVLREVAAGGAMGAFTYFDVESFSAAC